MELTSRWNAWPLEWWESGIHNTQIRRTRHNIDFTGASHFKGIFAKVSLWAEATIEADKMLADAWLPVYSCHIVGHKKSRTSNWCWPGQHSECHRCTGGLHRRYLHPNWADDGWLDPIECNAAQAVNPIYRKLLALSTRPAGRQRSYWKDIPRAMQLKGQGSVSVTYTRISRPGLTSSLRYESMSLDLVHIRLVS
jgi:hypothetical protein